MATVVSPTRHGLLFHEELDRPIGKSLRVYGEWAEEELYLLSSFVRAGAVVIDVGANIGTHALAFSRFVTAKGHVIAIEPQEAIFSLLTVNTLLNDAGHVRCIRALAAQESRVRFLPVERRSDNNSAAVTFLNATEADTSGLQQGPLFPTPTFALDDLALTHCDLIKIDVEAMELDVLLGARDLIGKLRPTVYFEQTSPRRFPEIFRYFADAGYALFWHAADPFNRNNFRRHTINIFGGKREINVLALPRENRSQWEKPTSQLYKIESPNYDAPPCQDSESGWSLPEAAYAHLPLPRLNPSFAQLGQDLIQAAAAPKAKPSP